MRSLDRIKNNRIVTRILFATSALGIVGLVGLSTASALPMSIKNSGPFSFNSISTYQNKTVTIDKVTSVSTETSNSQSASTGSATVSDNTNGGNATSGNATNTSTNVVVTVVKN